jgi:hypothetical protein
MGSESYISKTAVRKHIGHTITINDSAEWTYIWCEDCESKIWMGRK